MKNGSDIKYTSNSNERRSMREQFRKGDWRAYNTVIWHTRKDFKLQKR